MNTKIIPIVILYFFISFSGFSGNHQLVSRAIPDSISDVARLSKERLLLISNGQSTKVVDRQLSTLGHMPSAIVAKSSTDPATFVLELETYKTVTSANVDRITDRMTASYAELKQITITPADGHVKAEFISSTSEETLLSFLLNLGYKGYEVK